jgi:pSer/pThr/pTyr-binding forkhead associated (FHA) protein
MKVNLVVTAAGPNQGRSIPVSGAKFLIGRDASCQLRPASQAVSKQHCAIHIRNGQVWVEDFGSTNGTIVNDDAVSGQVQMKDGDRIRIGPLEFRLQIVPTPTPADGTPLPDKLKPLSASTPGTPKPAPSSKVTAPAPVPPKAAEPDAETVEGIVPVSPAKQPQDDDAAAMLLGMDDTPSGESPSVPEGSTVMEIPAVDAAGRLIPPKPTEKKAEVESSNAAGDLLKKYFRRTGS